jgi:hypothetical protein
MPGNGSPAWTQGAPGAGPRQPAAMGPRHYPRTLTAPRSHPEPGPRTSPGMAAA